MNNKSYIKYNSVVNCLIMRSDILNQNSQIWGYCYE
jgi:hypothetical protein